MTEPPAPRLVEITPDNVDAALGVRVRDDQHRFVASVERSLAQAYAARDTAWPRLLMDGDEAVGFVMVGFDPEEEDPDFRAEIWRLNIGEGHQGRGYGRFAVQGVLTEARDRGISRVTVSWVPGEGSPEDFYLALGFRRTGRVNDGEVIGELFLD
ncbi:diamine N-acetyltransferase [Nocardiopsis terrae]|uniref:Diamine N-acetyltransferase n=1 Tax=Nocardiopsis terrae TaxID=372655 RepID=A0ABR9HH24_9ACTN|nr:GNAT family N-acetyltransferase [Nocardiopsis terrae]MBE1458130.1 diamine N-acetyltransferase [Nocardiopsis terrae]